MEAAVQPEMSQADNRPSHIRTAERIIDVAERLFEAPVLKITAPGGHTRDSVRVHFADRTIVASRRRNPNDLQREASFLRAMHDHGAPVPELLGQEDDLLFQSDLGTTRLTAELMRQKGRARTAVAAHAFESLWAIKSAARAAGIASAVPPIATGDAWLDKFAHTPQRLGETLGLPAADYDIDGLIRGLQVLAGTFVKWDARPGNAAVAADGSVHWFDWEDYGRRGGTEDFAFLIADEFWPLSGDASLALFEADNRLPQTGALGQLIRFAVLSVVRRLALIHHQSRKTGWIPQDRARRYDRIGADIALFRPLCQRGADMARHDSTTAPLAQWFEDLANPRLWALPAN